MNPRHWSRVLADLGGAPPLTCDKGHEPGEPCPAHVRVMLQGLYREAFRRGAVGAALRGMELDGTEMRSPAVNCVPGLVSVVVPVRGAHEELKLCLQCVKAHTPSDVQVIVVCPDDETDEVAEIMDEVDGRPRSQGWSWYGTGAPLGFPAACNFGVQLAEGEYVVLLNSDAYVGPGWTDVVKALDTPGVVACGPLGTNVSGSQGVNPPGTGAASTAAGVATFATAWRDGRTFPKPAVRRLVGFCLAVRRDAFDAAGGLWEGYGLGNYDDDDLCLRLLLGGGKLVVDTSVLVLHGGSKSFAELPGGQAAYARLLEENARKFEERWSWVLPEVHEWLDRQGVR